MLKIAQKTIVVTSNVQSIYFVPHMNKYTAPDLKSLAKAKFKIDRKPYPRKPYNVDVPRVSNEVNCEDQLLSVVFLDGGGNHAQEE